MTGLRAFTMPKWGIEMTEGTIAEWMIAEGTDFAKGDVLTLIETDKITNEYEAEFPGRLVRIVSTAGQTMPVGALLAVFADANAIVDTPAIDAFVAGYRPGGAASSGSVGAGDAVAATAPASAPLSPPPPATPDRPISPAAWSRAQDVGVDITAITGSGRGGRITLQDVLQIDRPAQPARSATPVSITPTPDGAGVFASPLAKRIARQHAIDLRTISGSGRNGRIGKDDVLKHVRLPEAAPAPALEPQPQRRPAAAGGVTVVRMSPMRKAIARQLSLSKSTIPHFYLRNSAQIDALLAFRTQAKRATGDAPSINDYLVRACALALRAHPDINVQVHEDEIHQFASADISVAVATDKGLLTPIVRGAEGKSVAAISAEIKQLAARARAGKLAAEEFQGGSFSVSNLGMFGIEQFDAIINPPQGAILAIGASRQEAQAANHALAFATRVQLSLSCDHRAIDGAVGARFLAELTRLIETPEELTA